MSLISLHKPYPISKHPAVPGIDLKIVDYKFEAKPWPIKIRWDMISELSIDKSLANSSDFIGECCYEFKKQLDRLFIYKFLKIFDDQEIKRLDKIDRFLNMTSDIERVRQTRIDSFRAAYC